MSDFFILIWNQRVEFEATFAHIEGIATQGGGNFAPSHCNSTQPATLESPWPTWKDFQETWGVAVGEGGGGGGVTKIHARGSALSVLYRISPMSKLLVLLLLSISHLLQDDEWRILEEASLRYHFSALEFPGIIITLCLMSMVQCQAPFSAISPSLRVTTKLLSMMPLCWAFKYIVHTKGTFEQQINYDTDSLLHSTQLPHTPPQFPSLCPPFIILFSINITILPRHDLLTIIIKFKGGGGLTMLVDSRRTLFT